MLRGVIAGESVDRNHRRNAVDLDVFHLFAQICRAGEHVVGILPDEIRRQGSARHDPVLAGVNLERAHGGHDDSGIGREARRAAFDVEEALRTHIGAEAGLRDEEVTTVDADHVGEHRRRADGDVAERSGVHENRRVLEGLQQVGLDRVEHDHRHRAARVEEIRGDRLAVAREADDHPAEPLAQILERR